MPSCVLYVRLVDGGALCIGLLPGHAVVELIYWKGDRFTSRLLREPELVAEPYTQKADGFGGVFGLGEKGANGWSLRIFEREEAVA